MIYKESIQSCDNIDMFEASKNENSPQIISTTNVVVKNKKSSKKQQPRKRIRRPIPEQKDFIPGNRPTEADVVSGRGGRSNLHPGNRRYWVEILRERPEYKTCGQYGKEVIAHRVYYYVTELQQGRFLQLDKKTKRWFILPKKVSIIKIKQALRDRHIPKWAGEGETQQLPTAAPRGGDNNQPARGVVLSKQQRRRGRVERGITKSSQTPQIPTTISSGGSEPYSDSSFNTLATEDITQILDLCGSDGTTSDNDKRWDRSIDMVCDLINELTPPSEAGMDFWTDLFSDAVLKEHQ